MKQFNQVDHEEMTMNDVLEFTNFSLPSVNDIVEGVVVRVSNQ